MMLTIELSDQQAAALEEKAARQGLTIQELIHKLVELETPTLTPQHGNVVEEMRKLRASVKPDPEGWTTRDYVNYGRR